MRPIVSRLRARAPELALFAAALVISGFTVLRQVDPFDEGLMLQAARRIMDGQVPYGDFLWVYGPGQPYLLAGAGKAFGVSLLHWRLLRVAVDAGVALVVFAVVRREAGWRWALAAWAVAAVTMAQPAGANPFPLALLFSLSAVGVATAARAGRGPAVAAGALIALAAAWRFDFAVYGAAGVFAALLARPEPVRARARACLVFGAASLGLGALLYLPLAIAVGPGDVADGLVAAGARGRQGLPFPLAYDGPLRFSSASTLAEDLKDVVGFYVPLACILGLALAALLPLARRRRPTPALAGLLVLGLGYLVYFLSRADEFHIQPLAVVVAAALPLALLPEARRGTGRPVVAAGAAVLAFLALAGAANRASALFLPPSLEPIDLDVADGVEAPPSTATAIERTVAVVRRRVPPGGPIYVATTRSDRIRITNPLFYVLAERDNPYDMDFGPLTTASAQRGIVRALRETRPRAVVRWTDPEATEYEPNRSSRSSGVRTLDLYLAARYRRLTRAGYYEVLVPRRAP